MVILRIRDRRTEKNKRTTVANANRPPITAYSTLR